MRVLRRLSACVVFLGVGSAFGGINLVSGPGSLVVNPVSMVYTADPYNVTNFFYWAERTNHTLASDLVVSILPPAAFPGFSISHANDNSLSIANGTTIDSYYIHFDPLGASAVATFSFDDPIVGLITNSRDTTANDHFMMSDFLIDPAVPGVNIPAVHFDFRGIEPSINSDFIRWLSPFSIEVHLGASSPGDQLRILTSPVPEPGTCLCAAFGLLAAFRLLHSKPGRANSKS